MTTHSQTYYTVRTIVRGLFWTAAIMLGALAIWATIICAWAVAG